MKTNTRITAGEIISSVLTPDSQFKTIEEIFGKVRVRIAGISGIVTPEHIINIPTGVKEIDVIIGNESTKITFEGDNEIKQQTDKASEALKAKGTEVTERQSTNVEEAPEVQPEELPTEATV
jgi:hypothetical protein